MCLKVIYSKTEKKTELKNAYVFTKEDLDAFIQNLKKHITFNNSFLNLL